MLKLNYSIISNQRPSLGKKILSSYWKCPLFGKFGIFAQLYVLEVETDIRVTLGGKKRRKATLLMLLNCINKISTIKTNEKEQKTMNNVYEQKKTQEVIELSNGPFI